MIDTLTTNSFLYRVNRNRLQMEIAIQKRKAIGYCIKILLVIAIGLICWQLAR